MTFGSQPFLRHRYKTLGLVMKLRRRRVDQIRMHLSLVASESLTAEMPNLRDARSRLSPSADSILILGVPLPGQ